MRALPGNTLAKTWWNSRTPEQRAENGRKASEGLRKYRWYPFGSEHCHMPEERARLIGMRNVFGKYGLTPEDEARLYERQRGCCALCFTPFPEKQRQRSREIVGWMVDHDHASGVVRGLLCVVCNSYRTRTLEDFGERGAAYTVITPVDRYLQAHAEMTP